MSTRPMLSQPESHQQPGGARGMTTNSVDPFKSKDRCNKKVLKILLAVFVLLSVALFIALLVVALKPRPSEPSICTTKQCIYSSSALLESLDETKKPCEDFYSFVCGKFLRQREDKTTPFVTLMKQLNAIVRELLEEPNEHNEMKAVVNARKAYVSCIDTERIQEVKAAPLAKYLDTLNGWPLVKPVRPFSVGTGESILAKLHRVKLQSTKLLTVSVMNDFDDPTTTIITIDKFDASEEIGSRFGQKRNQKEHYEQMLNAFIANTIPAFARALGNEDADHLNKSIAEFIKFKTELSRISEGTMNRKNFTLRNNKMTLSELRRLTPNINWMSFFTTLFSGITKISEKENIIVQDLEYFRRLNNLWNKWDKRTIINLAIWNAVIEPLLFDISVEGFDEKFLLSPERWSQQCVPQILKTLALVTGKMFLKKHSNPKLVPASVEFIRSIKSAYKDMISSSKWLDETTKNNAIAKLDTLHEHIAYPETIELDETFTVYNNLEIGDDYLTNKITLYKTFMYENLRKLHQPVTGRTWPEVAGIINVNAFYDPTENAIIFPLGIINPPFFGEEQLASVNFGGVGSIIGHEIGHGFDNSGSQFDKDGKIRSWWTEKSKEEYNNRLQCYSNQYNQYCFDDFEGAMTSNFSQCLNGTFTLGENAPDNTGLQAAYNGFKKWVSKHGGPDKLPGLEKYSSEQLFFISFAYIWCDGTTAHEWFLTHSEDTHSPGRYRVQGSLANFPEFAKVFNCPAGQMNHGDGRCTLW